MPFTPVELDLKCVWGNIERSIAPSTFSAYSSAWLLWLSHLRLSGNPQPPFSESLVLSFLDSLMAKSLSWSHINKTLAGVSFFLQLQNYPACSSLFSVRQALKGYKKATFRRDSRMAITPDILSRLCSAVDTVCFRPIFFGPFFHYFFRGVEDFGGVTP